MSSLTPRIDKLQKNYIINSEMRIAQRGTSFASVASGGYGLDRWVVNHTGTAVQAISQDATDFPTVNQAGYAFQQSMRFNLTTAQAVLASGDSSVFAQRIEGFNFRPLYGKTFTLSFWVKATLPGIYCVWFQNNAANRSYVSEYTINATATWEYKSVTVTHDITGTWLLDSNIGMRVGWTIAAGTGQQGPANSWQSTGAVATANQVNGVANLVTAADFRITGVSIYEGDLDSPEFTTFGDDAASEVIACQRYYEKSYDITVNPATVTAVGQTLFNANVAFSAPTAQVPYKVMKRATTPTVTIYNPATGATGTATGNAARTATVGAGSGQSGYDISFANGGVNEQIRWHWTSESEI